MRYTPSEKLEIIRAAEESDLPVKRTLEQLQVSRGSFYRFTPIRIFHSPKRISSKIIDIRLCLPSPHSINTLIY